MRHLTPEAYRRMPWANGRGTTTEMMRVDGPEGLLWRLSMASVIEDGPFSLFPGIERNLTVISGPGFDLAGEGLRLRADPLVPVAFPGDLAIAAGGVTAPSADLNVMTARAVPRPEVWLAPPGAVAAGGLLCLFALAPGRINDRPVGRHDLCLAQESVTLAGPGPVLAIRLFR